MMRMGSQSFFLSTSQPIEMTTSAMTAATPACMARSTSCTIRLFWKAVCERWTSCAAGVPRIHWTA